MGVRVVFRPEATATGAAGEAPGPVLLVPATALVQVDGRLGAFALERDVARFHAVTVGERQKGRAVVEQGLTAGMRVVLDPPASLRDGDRVRPPAGQENP
jgi:multidrug efflux pump subunit AcrA (membrane-fusion protein)